VKSILAWLLLLYLVTLHSSMAGMEIFAWTTCLTSFGYQIRKRNFKIFHANRAVNIWLLAFIVSVALSLAFVPLYRPFWFQFGFMRWTVVLWGLTFALQEVWDETFERRLLTLWIVLIGVTGAYAGLQCFTGRDFIRTDAVEVQADGIWKAVGWFSASLTFAYNFGVGLFAQAKPAFTRISKRWGAIVCLSGGLGLIASVSRGSWLASIVCVLVYLWFTRRVLVVPAAAFFYALSKLLIWYSAGFGGKIEGMEQMHVDHSSSVRLDLWQGYFAMWKDHPFFGVGVEQGDKFLPEYFARLGIDQEFVSHAHNNFLQFLGGTGTFGFVAYCGLIFIFLRKAWRLRNVTAWGWSLFLAQLYMQLGGLTEANFIDGEVNHMLIFTWAILLVVEARQRKV
jgi:O-antigen ligase